ncbi:MAG: GxxExxY protein [Planctomycetota bacterium]
MNDKTNDLIERVIGAAIEAHRHFGPGFLESTYHSALLIELKLQGVSYRSEVAVDLDYKGHKIGQGRIDLLVEDHLVIELKSTDAGPNPYKRQVLAYLKATSLPIGLVINFGSPTLKDGIGRVRD